MRRPILFTLLIVATCIPVFAQGTLQTPEEYLGYRLGDRFTRHHQVVDYVHHVSAASPNVEIQQYGTTVQGRPLLVALVSTPANLARLEEIRTNNLKLAGILEGETIGEALSIVWLSYNVHGNESVSTEAAMATLYDLANPSNQRAGTWLENTLVILDPTINPDGRDRYVNWYNEAVGAYPNVNPEALEHSEPGPGGRTNHYNFDLNRDWTWLTQQETRARIALYNQWMPHIHVDFHEQGVNSPYYFAPGAQPYHAVITDWQREFQDIIGRNHARYFDSNGWLYFTKQVFDLFYPGYGDTFPMYNGAIGMTYEQGGGGRAGLGILTAEEDTLTLADRIAHHHTTSLSTIEMGSTHRERVLSEFQSYFSEARTSPSGDYKTYIVKRMANDARLEAVAEHLTMLGIESGTVGASRRINGYAYRSGQATEVTVEPGDLVITSYQPRSTLLQVLFEPVSAISDSITYDITAWALPYAYDVEAYASTERLDPVSRMANVESGVVGNVEQPYAWLAHWSDVSDVRFLSALLQREINVRYAEKAFVIEGQAFEPGTLIITRTGNEKFGDGLGTLLDEIASTHGQVLAPVRTGYVDSGADFGSGDVRYIGLPEIAVLRGDGISSSSSGQIWHFFDTQVRYPVTMMSPATFSRANLDDYDVLVLPSGSYGSILSDAARTRLLSWIRSGGRVVAVGSAATFFMGKDAFALKEKKAPANAKSDDDKDADADTLKVYGERDRDRVTDSNDGAIYQVKVDVSHPLAFGFRSDSFILKRGTTAPSYLAGSNVWNVGVLKEGSLVSGQVGYAAQKKIEESLAFGTQDIGSGSITYIIDDPLFRGFWYSGRLLMGNAIFLVGR